MNLARFREGSLASNLSGIRQKCLCAGPAAVPKCARRWRGSREKRDREVIDLFLCQAFRLKLPSASPAQAVTMTRKTKPTPERPGPSRPRKATVLPEPRAAKVPRALRRAAEAALRRRRTNSQPESMAHVRRLQHALEVHQIELEMQNAQLLQTQNELQTALERYAELYDFAPAGYLVLKPDSTILEANLTSARLLGLDRARLLKRRVATFIDPDACGSSTRPSSRCSATQKRNSVP